MRSPLLALTLLSALAIAACGSDDSAATDPASPTTEVASATTEATVETVAPTTEAAPETTEAPLPELEVIGQGPYDVGVKTITINEGTERPLTVDVWFPIEDAAGLPAHEYTLIPGLADVSDLAVDADPSAISPDGPFPLVVYSHGSGGLRYISSDYTETIASHGYIVAAPDHTGNTALDTLLCSRTTGPVTAINRVQDVETLIDALVDPQNTETTDIVTHVDPESIAVTGHSLGGFTTFGVTAGYENDLGSVPADSRIDAIIPLAPAIGGDRPPIDQSTTTTTDPETVDRCADATAPTAPPTEEEIAAARNRRSITDEQLASITIPAMVIVGADDSTTPVDPNVTRVWEFAGSEPLYRVELVAGQHQSFTNACHYLNDLWPTWSADLQELTKPVLKSQASEGCGDGIMEIDRAFDLTNTFAISFLDSIFRGGEMIDPETTAFPDDVIFMIK